MGVKGQGQIKQGNEPIKQGNEPIKQGKVRINQGDAGSVFRQLVGRDLRPDELTWLSQGRGDRGRVSDVDAARYYANGLKTLSQRILSDAQNIYGLKNFGQTEADKLRDSLYIAGDQQSFNTFNDRYGAALERVKGEQLQNPPVDPAQQRGYFDTVKDLVRTTLGRDPSQYEMDFYAKKMAQGDSAYELQQFLQNTPEFMDRRAATENERVRTESAAARSSLNTELLGSENEAFQRALPDIISSYQKAGRLNSSGLQNAIARSRADLARERQNFLAQAGYEDAVRGQGYSREDFVGAQKAGFDNFLRQSAPSQARDAAVSQLPYTQPFAAGQALRTRSQQLEDYYRQQSDFNRYLEMQRSGQRQSAQWGLGGDILGAVLRR